MSETPDTILNFWFGDADADPAAQDERMSFWFGGGPEADRLIAARFRDTLRELSSGEARRWAFAGPRERLAAVIGLDQFPRSIFRNTPASFETDPVALDLTKEGLVRGDDLHLRPLERWFLYMPLEHSETIADQRLSVAKFSELADQAPAGLERSLGIALDYARRHAAVIEEFGRFPHRNAILGRAPTPAEAKFLEENPSGFYSTPRTVSASSLSASRVLGAD